jgi:hypothetical protein
MHCNPDVRIVHRGKSKRLSAQRESCSSGDRPSSPSSGISKPITAWIAVTSKGKQVTGCMPCCAQ